MAGSPLMLPGQLADLLNDLGFIWPKSDEVKMIELGGEWVSFGSSARSIQQQGKPHIESAKAENKGQDIDSLDKVMSDKERGPKVLEKAAVGAAATGAGLFFFAGVVLALKIAVIVQLAILLAQIITALASAGPTFGASLAWIPVSKKLTSMAVNFLISQALKVLLG